MSNPFNVLYQDQNPCCPFSKKVALTSQQLRSICLMIGCLLAAGTASAQLPYNQSFKTNSAPGIVFGGSPTAFLTAGQTVSYSGGTTTDGANAGFLRLTPNQLNAVGYMYSNSSFPAQNGLKLEFEYFVYATSPPADGFTFFLFDGATSNFSIGAFGGGLGYEPFGGASNTGVSNGYMGIGFDVYGNYSTTTSTTTGVGFRPNNVVVRGPGNGSVGYNYLTGVNVGSFGFNIGAGINAGRVTDSTLAGYRRAIIELVPKPVSGGYSYDINVTIVTGGSPTTYNQILNNYTGFSSVAPTNLRYGFAGSTGAQGEAHEIRNLHADAYYVPTTPPSAVNDTYTLGCPTTVAIPVLNNDVPVNAPLAFDSTSVRLINPSNLNDTGNSYTIANVGTFSTSNAFGSNGKITFTQVPTFAGTTSIRYVVKDNYGLQSNMATLTIDGTHKPVITANAVVSPSYSVSGQEIQTVYLGYPAAQNETFTVTPTGGTAPYAFAWSGVNCNSAGIASNLLQPNITGNTGTSTYNFAPNASFLCAAGADNIYTYTVTISDNAGCAKTETRKLNVVNPYTQPGGDLMICHKVAVRGGSVTQLMQVPQSQVAVHLSHGDGLGNCTTFNGSKSIPEPMAGAQEVAVYPNPSTGVFVLELSEVIDEAQIMITDIQGRVVVQKTLKSGDTPTLTFDLSAYSKGLYLVQVKDAGLNYRTKIVVQ